jgi:hypothetical protein
MSAVAEQAPAPEIPPRRHPPGRSKRLAGRVLLYLGAVLLALWVVVPIYFITVTAFLPRADVYAFPKQVIPETFSADTMAFFVGSAGVLSALRNSVVVALITLALSTLLGLPDIMLWGLLLLGAVPVLPIDSRDPVLVRRERCQWL